MLRPARHHADRDAAAPSRPARWVSARRPSGPPSVVLSAGERVVRAVPPGMNPSVIPAFPAYERELATLGAARVPSGVSVRWSPGARSSRVIVTIERGASLYGTGENAGSLLRNGTAKVCWNTDRFDYDDASPSLYQSHPFVLAVRGDGTAIGIIFETTWRCAIDLRRAGRIVCEVDGPMPVVAFIERETPAGVVTALADLTGHAPLPPRWALGYHQCRWSYHPDTKVMEIAREFRSRTIPCDVLWMDIDYMDGFRCFTFDGQHFAKPEALNESLHALGFKTVYMIDPGLKVDPEYGVYRDGLAGGHFIRDRASAVYHGKVWPGDCAFPDFTREPTRVWWASHYAGFMSRGVDGVWNDMNEPAVFESFGKTMPDDNRHEGDAALGGAGPHVRYHNIYGMQMVRATREGIRAAAPGKRPFVLTRANFLGGHRYAATWTGDNRSDWRHLRWSIPMALNLGLCGQPFVGPDIGGFIGDADAALFARWMGIASLLPFARAHSIKDSQPHEPWSFGPECEAVCRLALERRYRLLPYLYTLFREATVTGLPLVRPLMFADASDPRLRGVENAFLLGGDVLVRADTCPAHGAEAAPSPAPMPRGRWARFEPLGERVGPALAALPELWLRAGGIVPVGPAMEYVGQHALDPLTLFVHLDERGEAVGRLYEDAGEGHAHERGEFRLTTFRARRVGGDIRVEAANVEGEMPEPTRRIVVRAVG